MAEEEFFKLPFQSAQGKNTRRYTWHVAKHMLWFGCVDLSNRYAAIQREQL